MTCDLLYWRLTVDVIPIFNKFFPFLVDLLVYATWVSATSIGYSVHMEILHITINKSNCAISHKLLAVESILKVVLKISVEQIFA